jgi:hypothetical protein
MMTKKNAKKAAARARQEALGGRYQKHLRQVGGADGAGVEIVPKFDPSDPRNKTRQLATGAYQDPVRPVEIVSGSRTTLVWIAPHAEGRTGWRFEVTHQGGPWPLDEKERAALEDWLEDFAKGEWPTRTQLWPTIYRATAGAGDATATDDGQVTTYYAVLHGEPGSRAFAPTRRAPGVSHLLFAFEGPAFDSDAALAGYFAQRFLPLQVFYYEDGDAHLSDTFPSFVEASMFASALRKLHADVRILTQEGHEVWRAIRSYPGYPSLLGGTEKYEGSDLAFGNGDFQETADGDLAEVTGTAALGQYIEIAILNARPTNGDQAEAAMKKAIQEPEWKVNFQEITAFRSDDKVAEIEFVAIGYPSRTQRVVFKR